MMEISKKDSVLQSLLNKKSVFFSLILLFVMLLFSLFAYIIIPDSTPNANSQNLDLSLKKPGFRTEIIEIQNPEEFANTRLLKGLIYGFPNIHTEVPFKEMSQTENQIILTNHFDQIKYIQLDDQFGQKKPFIKKTKLFIFGTDKFGRDIFSRLILGIRLSLFIGLMSVILSLLIGVTIGSLGGYFGGGIDKIVMYLINVTWSIPTLLLVFAIVIAFGRGLWVIFLAVGLTLWVDVARLVRGQVLQIKESEFIMASKSLSFSTGRIITKHILPNIIGPILVIAASNFAIAILIEAGLSYLGFGIQPPAPSVGNMLNENYGYAISGKPFLAMVPAMTIMLMVLAFNLVGSGLRDILDVKSLN